MYIRRKVFSILTDEMGEERLYSVSETALVEEEREFARKDYQVLIDGVDYADQQFRNEVKAARDRRAANFWKGRKAAVEKASKEADEFLKTHPDHPKFYKKIHVEGARKDSYEKYKLDKFREGSIRRNALENLDNRIMKRRLRSNSRSVIDLYDPAHHGNTTSARLERINKLRQAQGKEVLNTRNDVTKAIENQVSRRQSNLKNSTTPNTPTTNIPNTSTPTPTNIPTTAKPATPKSAPKPKANIGKGSIFNGSFNPMKWSKGAKIGGGIAAGAALIGTGVYLHNKNKKNKE